MQGLIEGLWLAWCPTCGQVKYFGELFRNIGWPFCDKCRVTEENDSGVLGTPWKWVPPDNGDGVLRIWDEAE